MVKVFGCAQDSGHGELGEAAAVAGEFGVWEVPAAMFPAPVTDLAMGSAHSLFVLETGELFSCGSNFHGQCGFPETTARPGPKLESKIELKTDQSDAAHSMASSDAAEPQNFLGNPIKPGDKLKCVKNALARKDADVASERTCYLKKGARITALEVRQLEGGIERVRFENGAFYGWISRKFYTNAEKPACTDTSIMLDIVVPDDGVEVPANSLRIEGADNEQVGPPRIPLPLPLSGANYWTSERNFGAFVRLMVCTS